VTTTPDTATLTAAGAAHAAREALGEIVRQIEGIRADEPDRRRTKQLEHAQTDIAAAQIALGVYIRAVTS
jgi:hypothetical protein